MRTRLNNQRLRGAGIAFGLFCGIWAASAHAQLSSKMFACEELKTQAALAHVNKCITHPGCLLVLKLQTKCAVAAGFLSRLNSRLQGRPFVSATDVFEALRPPVNDDPAFTKASDALAAAFERQANKTSSIGQLPGGDAWFYEGPLVNGEFQGTGIFGVFEPDFGLLYRAQFVAGSQKGRGEAIRLQAEGATDHRVGDLDGFNLNGEGSQRFSNGDRFIGQYKDGKRIHGILTWPSGTRYEGAFSDNQPHGRGTYLWKNGDKFVGEMRAGELFNGAKKDAAGKEVAAYVNGKQKDAAAAAPARAGAPAEGSSSVAHSLPASPGGANAGEPAGGRAMPR